MEVVGASPRSGGGSSRSLHGLQMGVWESRTENFSSKQNPSETKRRKKYAQE